MHDKFAPLLKQAFTEPGIVSAAYGRFHRFSIGNQILAAVQLQERRLADLAYCQFQSMERPWAFGIKRPESTLAVDADHRQASSERMRVTQAMRRPTTKSVS
jgi:DUF1365 family protein